MPGSAHQRSEEGLPLTVNDYAALHGVSRAQVRKWMAHGRVKYERRGGGQRAEVVLIWQRERPPRVEPGTLAPEARAAWPNRATKRS